jgi:hypothetical protein
MDLKIDIGRAISFTNIFTATRTPAWALHIKPAGPASSPNSFSSKASSARSRDDRGIELFLINGR